MAWRETGDVDPAGPDEIASLDRLEAEHDNLRAALRWTLDHEPVEAGAARHGGHVPLLGAARDSPAKAARWLEQALAGASEDAPPRFHGRVLSALANFYWRGGEPARARPLTERALDLARAAGDVRGEAWALFSLGMIAYFLRRIRRSRWSPARSACRWRARASCAAAESDPDLHRADFAVGQRARASPRGDKRSTKASPWRQRRSRATRPATCC